MVVYRHAVLRSPTRRYQVAPEKSETSTSFARAGSLVPPPDPFGLSGSFPEVAGSITARPWVAIETAFAAYPASGAMRTRTSVLPASRRGECRAKPSTQCDGLRLHPLPSPRPALTKYHLGLLRELSLGTPSGARPPRPACAVAWSEDTTAILPFRARPAVVASCALLWSSASVYQRGSARSRTLYRAFLQKVRSLRGCSPTRFPEGPGVMPFRSRAPQASFDSMYDRVSTHGFARLDRTESYERRAPAMDSTAFWTAPIPRASMPFAHRLLDRLSQHRAFQPSR